MSRPDRHRRAVVSAFWDYGLYNAPLDCTNVVLVDTEGAGVLPCATTSGDQLRHLTCPLDGPCEEEGR